MPRKWERQRHSADTWYPSNPAFVYLDEMPPGPADRLVTFRGLRLGCGRPPDDLRARLDAVMSSLPAIDQDILRLRLLGWRESRIARVVGGTQQSVSHRLRGLHRKIDVIRRIDLAAMRADLAPVVTRHQLRYLLAWAEHLSQVAAARAMDERQQRVSGYCVRGMRRMRASSDPDVRRWIPVFDELRRLKRKS